ncbi:hypothetical protein JCM11251_007550 [Rhodosporidiobolus azoricus]
MPKRTRSVRGDDEVAPTSSVSGGRGGHGDDASKRKGAVGLRFKGASSTAPALKRSRPSTILPALSLEGSLSEEILLRVLSFLDAHDLVTVARVSSAWHRLSYDAQLWRDLYLHTYASASIRRQSAGGGHVARTRPWRDLFKISSNWRNGSARTSTLGKGIRQAVLPEAPGDFALRPAGGPRRAPTPEIGEEEMSDTLLQFHQHFFFTASRTATPTAPDPPAVTVHQTLPSGESAVVGSFSSPALHDYLAARSDFRPSLAITELRLDESASFRSTSTLLLAVFYSTGHFSLFRISLPSTSPSLPFSAREVFSSLALDAARSHPFLSRLSSSSDHVQHARLYSPLLVTCSESLTVRFWRIEEKGDGEVVVEEADTPLQTSERGWRPVVLSLAKVEAHAVKGDEMMKRWKDGGRKGDVELVEKRFCVTLAYSTPVFPASWTVGLQEFVITVPPASSVTDPRNFHPRLSISARHATALPLDTPLPPTPRRSSPLSSRPTTLPMPRNPVTSIEHSHPFVVASRRDNQLDVYEVVSSSSPVPPTSPSSTPPRFRIHPRVPSPPQLRLEHRRTLFGHTARVAGVALLDSTDLSGGEGSAPGSVRCVSAGDDGAVKVWELVPTCSPNDSRADASSVTRTRKRRRMEEPVIDVDSLSSAVAAADEGGETAWQRMKRRRLAGVHGKELPVEAAAAASASAAGDRPERIKRVFVDVDKIVLVGGGGDGQEERNPNFASEPGPSSVIGPSSARPHWHCGLPWSAEQSLITCDVALVGVGLVGKEVVRQLCTPALRKVFRIVSLSNSRHTVFLNRDAPHLDADTLLALVPSSSSPLPASSPLPYVQYSTADPDTLVQSLSIAPSTSDRTPASASRTSTHKCPTILVDCTSSLSFPSLYPFALSSGVSVVTPNKKGFASSARLYEDIMQAEASEGAGWCYAEATVGAGLPIQTTLRDLLATGDEVTKIEGVFSGTLSYLFNQFSPGKEAGGTLPRKFSEIVREAKEHGHTEPHPADDLSGSDVARKLTILARLMSRSTGFSHASSRPSLLPLPDLPEGYASVPTQSLVPAALASIQDPAEFVARLAEYDEDFDQSRDEAEEEGKVLRYVGVVDRKTGEIKCGLEKYPLDHPFASLSGSHLSLAFYTKRYGDRPLIVQGPGYPLDVTAMAVVADCIRVAERCGARLGL